MKERSFEIVSPDDEIFENLADLGAFNFGGQNEKKIEEDFKEKAELECLKKSGNIWAY